MRLKLGLTSKNLGILTHRGEVELRDTCETT